AWAQQVAAVPHSVTQVVSRVSYPALAQLRDDRAAFVETVAAALKWTCAITLPALAVLTGLAPEIIRAVYGPKWLPALPVLYLLSVNTALGVGTAVLNTMLYAAGRAGLALRISLIWASVTWGAALVMVGVGAGFVGLAAASTLGTAVALVGMVRAASDLSATAAWKATRRSLLSAVCVGLALFLAAPLIVQGLTSLAAL